MSKTSVKGPYPFAKFYFGWWAFLILIAFVLPALLLGPSCRRRRPRVTEITCMGHLHELALGLIAYVEDHEGQYPPAERWCDVLAAWDGESSGRTVKEFRDSLACPEVGGAGWGYAVNPLARPEGDPNVVLLFESDAGWNGFGGAELLVTGRHREGCCNVLSVSGTVMRVKAAELGELNWGNETAASSESRHARQPESDDEQP